MPALAERGIRILNHADRNGAERRWVSAFFEAEVRPLLVPVGLDPSHPFPQVANKSLNFIARLAGRDAFGRENTIAIVKVPRVLPRVIKLPEALAPPGKQVFVLLTSVIRAHLAALFPGVRGRVAAGPAAAPAVDLPPAAQRRRAAAPSVRILRARGPVPARSRERPRRARHQADHLPHRERVAVDGPAHRRGTARQ